MKQTDTTLLEQLRITDFEVDHRKKLFSVTREDIRALINARPTIEANADFLVTQFYNLQTAIPEIALVIGDADTLRRLKSAQHKYIIDLFSGIYDLEYVNNRLRIGLVHKRIGVEPKLYLAGIHTLSDLLEDLLRKQPVQAAEKEAAVVALRKMLMFDIALVFETYIRSLVSEIQSSRDKSEQYALSLEEKVRERTQQLEELSRIDPLTGLLNVRYLTETLSLTLRSAQRRQEAVTMAYIDIDDFKAINDTQGHQRGDDLLRTVSSAIKGVSRIEDHCFRYGGDEFCIILGNCTQQQAEEIYLTRLNESIAKYGVDISISVGFAQTGPETYITPEALIGAADNNMYTSKKQRKTSQGADDQKLRA